jgi:hypothetical protein
MSALQLQGSQRVGEQPSGQDLTPLGPEPPFFITQHHVALHLFQRSLFLAVVGSVHHEEEKHPCGC